MTSQKLVNHFFLSSVVMIELKLKTIYCMLASLCDVFSTFHIFQDKILVKNMGPEELKKKVWSKVEVAAVMRHFKDPIHKGKLT